LVSNPLRFPGGSFFGYRGSNKQQVRNIGGFPKTSVFWESYPDFNRKSGL
jgi:hypothetical protein